MPCFIELPAEIHQMIIAHYMPQLPTMGSEAAKGHGEYRDLWSSAAYSIAASCTEMLSATSEFMLRRCLEAGRELDIAKRGVYEPRPIAFYRFLIVGCTWSKLHRLSEALAGRALPVATNKDKANGCATAFGLSARQSKINAILSSSVISKHGLPPASTCGAKKDNHDISCPNVTEEKDHVSAVIASDPSRNLEVSS